MLKEKRCPSCGETKSVEFFYWVKKLERFHSWCKKCISAHRYNNNGWHKRNKGSEKVKESWRRASLKSQAKYPEKKEARIITRIAVKKGKIAKLACEVCGNFLSEAHHVDYSKPLEVIWLCKKHHRQVDKLNNLA